MTPTLSWDGPHEIAMELKLAEATSTSPGRVGDALSFRGCPPLAAPEMPRSATRATDAATSAVCLAADTALRFSGYFLGGHTPRSGEKAAESLDRRGLLYEDGTRSVACTDALDDRPDAVTGQTYQRYSLGRSDIKRSPMRQRLGIVIVGSDV